MSLEILTRLLNQKENIRLEFKEAITALPNNLFESICAMLNRDGGDIILGANDNGVIVGVDPLSISSMVTNLVSLSNNNQKLDPPFILFPQIYQLQDKKIIHIQVPASSQVHKTNNIVFDRSNDGDFKVTQPHRIAEIYNRKRNHYTEGTIYSALRFQDLRIDLFPRIKNLIRSNNYNHPWLDLTEQQILEKAGLWKRDSQTGKEGYTLACALLLGKDEVIQSIVPHYKIDALLRIKNTARYDDREYIQTNLIEAYDHLMNFVAKHLSDKFYMEEDQRVSLRTKIFREIVANLLVHREYTNAYPCTFIIYADRVEAINASNPNGQGLIDPNNFVPFTKNPSIAKFFIQLGRGDELGSGVLNINKLINNYTKGGVPQFIEGSFFKVIIPLKDVSIESKLSISNTEIIEQSKNEGLIEGLIEGAFEGLTKGVKNRLVQIIKITLNRPNIKIKEFVLELKVSERTIKENIKILTDNNLIYYKGSNKTGGYYLTNDLLSKIKDE